MYICVFIYVLYMFYCTIGMSCVLVQAGWLPMSCVLAETSQTQVFVWGVAAMQRVALEGSLLRAFKEHHSKEPTLYTYTYIYISNI